MELKRLAPGIIDRGRGPEIEGSRITVYDVMDYHPDDHHAEIALRFHLSSRQVLEAIAYIEAHRAEVEADYKRIIERHSKGNPPEIEAKLAKSHEKVLKKMKELAQKKEQTNAALGR